MGRPSIAKRITLVDPPPSQVTVRGVPASGLEQVVVRLGQGDIRVTDETRTGVATRGTLGLDLRTGSGHVQSPGRR